jgi:hypothetical protein
MEIKTRKIRWAEHLAHMGEMRNAYNILVGTLEGRSPLKRRNVNGKIIVEWILVK